ncbi:MAG: hypothetical protein WEB13_04580 [Dehalococcoidia bacterium]
MSPTAKQTDRVQVYFDALIKSADALRSAAATSTDRNGQFAKQASDEFSNAQRDTLELSKKLAAAPTDATMAYAAFMESAVAAQARALRVGKLAYEHAAGTGADVQQSFEQLTAASRAAAEAALALSQEWASVAPVADAWRKGFEAFMPAAAAK